jgi:hypothetical protein
VCDTRERRKKNVVCMTHPRAAVGGCAAVPKTPCGLCVCVYVCVCVCMCVYVCVYVCVCGVRVWCVCVCVGCYGEILGIGIGICTTYGIPT